MKIYDERFNIKQINQLYHKENKTLEEISKIIDIPVSPLSLRMHQYIKLKKYQTKHCGICGKEIIANSYQKHYDSHWKILRLEIKCQWCKSINLVKDGFCKTKSGKMQQYLCRDCDKTTYLNPKNTRKIKITPEFKEIAKTLRIRGHTYKEICLYFKNHHKINIDTKTVWNWVNCVDVNK